MAAAELTLLSAGDHEQTGTTDPLDVSDHAQLRFTIAAHPDFGKHPQLDVTFQTAPAASGPWRQIAAVRMSSGSPPGNDTAWDMKKRVVLAAADNFIRAAWALRDNDLSPHTFAMSIVGTGVVSA